MIIDNEWGYQLFLWQKKNNVYLSRVFSVIQLFIMEQVRKLPVGIQSFEVLRADGCLYVDKTAMIYRLVSTSNSYFLSRPRRFGKSLLLSTFEAYFDGRKDLFEGPLNYPEIISN